MSHFLWIEDFESDIRATVDQVFGLAERTATRCRS